MLRRIIMLNSRTSSVKAKISIPAVIIGFFMMLRPSKAKL
jgi:hypothetical protein